MLASVAVIPSPLPCTRGVAQATSTALFDFPMRTTLNRTRLTLLPGKRFSTFAFAVYLELQLPVIQALFDFTLVAENSLEAWLTITSALIHIQGSVLASSDAWVEVFVWWVYTHARVLVQSLPPEAVMITQSAKLTRPVVVRALTLACRFVKCRTVFALRVRRALIAFYSRPSMIGGAFASTLLDTIFVLFILEHSLVDASWVLAHFTIWLLAVRRTAALAVGCIFRPPVHACQVAALAGFPLPSIRTCACSAHISSPIQTF